MKKILFLLFCGLQISSVYLQTNKYYNANESWIQTDLGMTMGQPNSITTKCFFVNGDSIIGSKIFKKVFRVSKSWTGTTFSGYSGSFVDPAYLVKEENDTVMVLSLLSPDTITDTSWISYNFNASMVYFRYFYSEGSPDYGIGSEVIGTVFDSIVINGITRRFFYTNGEVYEGVFGTSWSSRVEPFTNPPQFDGYRHLQCYAGNDSVYLDYSGEVWPGHPTVLNPPVPGNCNIDSIYWSSIDELDNKLLYLFPNPAINEFSLSGVQNLSNVKIIAINLLGEQIHLTSEGNAWDVSKLAPGIYTIQISIEKDIIFKKLIRI